ncbi:MAG: hypothetical protein ABIJ09_14740 [Pseudomonadota bacterium]
MDTHALVQHKSHQGPGSYAEANSLAAARARARLVARFEEGRRRLPNIIQALDENVPDDYLVVGSAIEFGVDNGQLRAGFAHRAHSVHGHALAQLAQRVDIPKAYIDLLATQQPELLAHNLQQRYAQGNGARFLARVVEGQVRGWLSSKFKRLDSGPVAVAFMAAARELGAVPVAGQVLDTKISLKWMLPVVYEPIANEVLAVGLHLRNSDYGDGALSICFYIERVWCTNGMSVEEGLRKVHLGARLDDVAISDDTRELEMKTLVSATRDVVTNLLTPEMIAGKMALIAEADAKQVPLKQTLEDLRKRARLSKAETERCTELAAVDDVELLPPVRIKPKHGYTSAWRLAHVVSALANESVPERALELQDLAGQLAGIDTVSNPASKAA